MKFIFVLLTICVFLLAYAQCQEKDKSACEQPKEVGPCRKADYKFYFDQEQKKCLQFIYGGCKGNDNRFDTQEDCEKLCV